MLDEPLLAVQGARWTLTILCLRLVGCWEGEGCATGQEEGEEEGRPRLTLVGREENLCCATDLRLRIRDLFTCPPASLLLPPFSRTTTSSYPTNDAYVLRRYHLATARTTNDHPFRHRSLRPSLRSRSVLIQTDRGQLEGPFGHPTGSRGVSFAPSACLVDLQPIVRHPSNERTSTKGSPPSVCFSFFPSLGQTAFEEPLCPPLRAQARAVLLHLAFCVILRPLSVLPTATPTSSLPTGQDRQDVGRRRSQPRPSPQLPRSPSVSRLSLPHLPRIAD